MTFKPTRGSNAYSGDIDHSRRILAFQFVACLAIGLLLVRLWYLQGIWGHYYRDLSENNRTRTIRLASPRGMVFDREGRVIVRNRSAFNVALLLEDTPDVNETLRLLSQITGRDAEQVIAQFRSRKKSSPFEPQIVLPDVTEEELARVKVNNYLLPGVIIQSIPTRSYPNGAVAAQVLGYTREVSKDQLAKLGRNYKRGDYAGQSGLEKQYESILKGEAGYLQVEVDARGGRKGELGIIDTQVGKDVQLTIDLDLQEAAETALIGKRGAVVAIEPSTGEVLALASAPNFDANVFSGAVKLDDWVGLNSDPGKPLTNRALASAYPPGSVIKLLWSLVGMHKGLISVDTKVNCTGGFQFGRRRYKCHSKYGHGPTDLRSAITMSCNTYFYQLGQNMGINMMHEYLDMFGFGATSGVDLPGEETGISPSPEWKRARYNQKWYPGDSVPVSIGQGYLIVTPMQMANFAATLGNGGNLYKPFLVKRVIGGNGEVVEQHTSELIRKIPIDPTIFRTVLEFATDVVTGEHGTGKRAALPNVRIAGKTGTAQVRAGAMTFKDEKFKDHAWFVAVAPIEAPTIAVAVIVENSGFGGTFAAPVSREVMLKHFLKRGVIKPEDLETKTVTPANNASRNSQSIEHLDEEEATQEDLTDSDSSQLSDAPEAEADAIERLPDMVRARIGNFANQERQ